MVLSLATQVFPFLFLSLFLLSFAPLFLFLLGTAGEAVGAVKGRLWRVVVSMFCGLVVAHFPRCGRRWMMMRCNMVLRTRL